MPLYYMLNKPCGCVTARMDKTYPTVMDCLPSELAERLHPLGRLDYDTRGLLLLTDDGELDPALLLPENHVDKEYFFYAIGRLTDEKIAQIGSGCALGGGRPARPARIILEKTYTVREIEPFLPEEQHDRYMKNPDGEAFSARIVLREGKKHQVKRMLRAVNCRICALFRTAFAGIPLDPTLAPGGVPAADGGRNRRTRRKESGREKAIGKTKNLRKVLADEILQLRYTFVVYLDFRFGFGYTFFGREEMDVVHGFRRILALMLALVTMICLLAPAAMAAGAVVSYPFDDDGDISGYARDAVYLCRKLNVMHGANLGGVYGFRPRDPITRQEIFRVVYALNNAGTEKENEMFKLVAANSAFEDRDQIAPWALCSAGYCISMGLFVGDGAGHLNPRANISYLEFAIVLLRILGYTQNTLAVQSGETGDAWRARIIETARDVGLFSDKFQMDEHCSDPLSRQDAAVMIALALDSFMVYYYPISKEQYYLPCDFTLLDNAFGKLTTRTGLVTSVTETETHLADGTVLPSVAHLRSDRVYLGRWIRYNVCEKNDMLSWTGDLAEDGDEFVCPAGEAALSAEINGRTRLTLGSDTELNFMAASGDRFLVMDQTVGTTVTAGYDELRNWLDYFAGSTEPTVLYLTLDSQGRIATLCGGLASEQ